MIRSVGQVASGRLTEALDNASAVTFDFPRMRRISNEYSCKAMNAMNHLVNSPLIFFSGSAIATRCYLFGR